MKRPSLDEPVYIISIAARLVGMHPQSLRLYERKGLIRPVRSGRKRLYSERDVERLRRIQQLTQDRRVNLAGVHVVFELLEKMETLRLQMEARMEQMEAELRDLTEAK